MKIKIEKSTCWFLITAVCNFIYSPIVHFFLKNPNLGERFKGLNATFYVSYIYIAIGFIWLVFGGLYIIADNAHYFKFTRKSKHLHFFLTLPFILCLMIVPLLETFYPLTDANRNSWFPDILTFLLPIFLLPTILALFGGIILFVINLVKALVNLIVKL
jgi:hypothetical protein